MPQTDYPFVPSDVSMYRRLRPHADNVLDEQTWDDMLLQQYSARLGSGVSIFGQQELHRRLHAAQPDAASVARVRMLASDQDLRQQLQSACADLRGADHEISETLYGPAVPPRSRWAAALPWLPRTFLLSAMLALATGWLPLWAVVLGLWVALMVVQVRHHDAVQAWRRILGALQLMLRVHTLLARVDDPLTATLRADAAQAGKLNRRTSRSMLSNIPMLADYVDWLLLHNVRHYFGSREAVRRRLDFLRSSFERVAALEADLALASHLAQIPVYCWAERGDEIRLTQLRHPLLADATPLTFSMTQQGAFISGQNGIGKSTLLRAVGLNLIVARAFGFCYAEEAQLPLLPVYSSMQNEDALEGGESLYLAELRRGQELLALAARAPAFFIIDEIFRGTNYLESVSAAASVLDALAQQGRVMVSSHNLVLAALLKRRYAPWCVSSVEGRLQLAPGVLRETNGIALLAKRGFDAAITDKADRIHAWLNDYMAHPEAVDHL